MDFKVGDGVFYKFTNEHGTVTSMNDTYVFVRFDEILNAQKHLRCWKTLTILTSFLALVSVMLHFCRG